MSSQPCTRYCRGCSTEVPEEQFDQYKQCGECRIKSCTRKRKSVTCECGRTLLACSLKTHLRSSYHTEHVKLMQQQLPPVKKLLPSSKYAVKGALPKLVAQPVMKLQPRPATQPLSTAKGSVCCTIMIITDLSTHTHSTRSLCCSA